METQHSNNLFLTKIKSKLIMPLAYFSVTIGVLSFLGGSRWTGGGFILVGGLIVLKSRAMDFDFKRQSGHIIYNGDNF